MKKFLGFLKENYALALITFLVCAVAFGTYWINSGDIPTDTEAYILNPARVFQVFERQSRFGMVITKKIFSTDTYVPTVFLSYAIITLSLAALVVDYCVLQLVRPETGKKLLWFAIPFNCMFVGCPVLAHQFYFYYQAFEVAFAYLLGALAAYLVLWGCLKKKVFYLLLGIAFMIWSFATYQIFVPYYIAVQALFFLIYGMYGDGEPKVSFAAAFKMVVVFLIGLAAYLAIAKLIIYLKYHVLSGSLADTYMGWGIYPLEKCLENIKMDSLRVLRSEQPGFSKYYLPVTALFLILGIRNAIREGRRAPLLIAAAVIFVASPYYMTFLLGNYQTLRAHLVYPFVLAGTVGMMMFWLSDIRLVRCLAAFAAAVMVFGQVDVACRIEETVHIVAEADRNMAETICISTEAERRLPDGTMAPMVFVGERAPVLLPSIMGPRDATGISFFTIASGSVVGSRCISHLMRCLGYDAPEPSEEQYEAVKGYADTMTVWPAEGSCVLKDGVMIIKLSEP